MKKRILAGLTASVLAAACAAQIPSILSVSAAGSYDMQLKIQLDGEKKAISPYIRQLRQPEKRQDKRRPPGRKPLYRIQLGNQLLQRR